LPGVPFMGAAPIAGPMGGPLGGLVPPFGAPFGAPLGPGFGATGGHPFFPGAPGIPPMVNPSLNYLQNIL